MTARMLAAAGFTVGVPLGLAGWLALVERLLRPLGRRAADRLRPWAWLTPGVVLLAVFLVHPLVSTLLLSTRDATSTASRGLGNFGYVLASAEVRSALRNNLLWLVLLTGGCLAVGLLVAILADGTRYESAAKAAVVLPTAISFVAGAVIWRSMYDYRPPGSAQTGTLNAVLITLTGHDPVSWLVDTSTNNGALVAVGIWMTTGFATVLLSAALKGVPAELVEAARMDGAGPWRTFRHVVLPEIAPALTVVATFLAVTAFKAFDVIYVLTNGSYDTDVIANVMYRELFVRQDYGHASAIAVLLLVVALPVLAMTLRGRRREVFR
ncbi:MAG TPA: sugar ABC transporter permease [Mycobacteriales bacterium]|jgi:alpha-glucoside transport system permease protein|nr:sugar ABC transporter permease [Mycobacteriales bacterium]